MMDLQIENIKIITIVKIIMIIEFKKITLAIVIAFLIEDYQYWKYYYKFSLLFHLSQIYLYLKKHEVIFELVELSILPFLQYLFDFIEVEKISYFVFQKIHKPFFTHSTKCIQELMFVKFITFKCHHLSSLPCIYFNSFQSILQIHLYPFFFF